MTFPLSKEEFALKQSILKDTRLKIYYVSVVGQAPCLAVAKDKPTGIKNVQAYYENNGFENTFRLFKIEKHYSLSGIVVLEEGEFTRF